MAKTIIEQELWEALFLVSQSISRHTPNDYVHLSHSMSYIRLAILRSLRTDGFKVAQGYDPHTGLKDGG